MSAAAWHDFWAPLIVTLAGGAVIGGATVFVHTWRKLAKLPEQLASVREGLERNGGLMRHMLRTQMNVVTGLITSLKCQKEGRCNGDVDGSLDALDKARQDTIDFLATSVTDQKKPGEGG